MPTYEYVCNQCSHRFETWQKMVDDPLTVCPQCGGHIRRVLFAAGIVFKGSGFYKTDHGSGSVAGENGHAPKSDDGGSAKEGESNPATTTAGTTSAAKPGESKSNDGKSGENKVTVEAK